MWQTPVWLLGQFAEHRDFLKMLEGEGYTKKTNYHILDLPGVHKLQRFYLSSFDVNFNIYFEDCFGYGSHLKDTFVISNYCLAEMGEFNRNKYFENLIVTGCIGGYLVWNSNASFDTLKNNFIIKSLKDEMPMTGPYNKIIIFTKQ